MNACAKKNPTEVEVITTKTEDVEEKFRTFYIEDKYHEICELLAIHIDDAQFMKDLIHRDNALALYIVYSTIISNNEHQFNELMYLSQNIINDKNIKKAFACMQVTSEKSWNELVDVMRCYENCRVSGASTAHPYCLKYAPSTHNRMRTCYKILLK